MADIRRRTASPAPAQTTAAQTKPAEKEAPKSFFQKYIAPNVFNFYPVASAIGLVYYANKNDYDFDKTMTNGGDQLVFLLCVKLCMLHNGLAHFFMCGIVHKSQGLQMTPGSLMFENELAATCLSMSIFSILHQSGTAVAVIAQCVGGFFFYAAARHVHEGQPIGTSLGGFGTGVFLWAAGFHAAPIALSKIF